MPWSARRGLETIAGFLEEFGDASLREYLLSLPEGVLNLTGSQKKE